MAKAHYISPRVPQSAAKTVRLGTNANQFKAVDEGKFVKLAAESQYNLCAAGDPIEAVIAAVETGTSGGHSIGSVLEAGGMFVLADGLQATPGTGTIAVGDYVVTGTVVALGTDLPTFPKVCKATDQPGTAVVLADNLVATINAGLVKVANQGSNGLYAWRVVSLGTAGTGAVGTTIVVERMNRD